MTINPLSKLHLIDLSQSSFDSNDQLQELINEKLRDDWGIEISQILPKYFDHKLFSEADNGTIAVREKNTVVDIAISASEKVPLEKWKGKTPKFQHASAINNIMRRTRTKLDENAIYGTFLQGKSSARERQRKRNTI